MKASLAMVVCFIGFQGIVPEAGSSADASTLEAARVFSAPFSAEDNLTPTGTVGPSLLATLDTQDALDPRAPRTVRGGAIHSRDITKSPATASEKRPAEGTLFAPLAELVPTSSFGFRTSPITGEAGEFHTGQDYAAPCGTTVFAADAGTVRAVGWHPWGGGNRVEVDHGNGLITTYNHLQGISVRAGDLVNGGDPIAAIGTTGSSTGCHLHFETILDGEHVDPLGWKLVHTAPGASKGELEDFTPGGASATAVPAWAQSSTRSDQPGPVTSPFSAFDGVANAGGPGAAPLNGLSAIPNNVGTPTVHTAPPVVTLPKPEQPPVTVVPAPQAGPTPGTSPSKPTTPGKPGATKPAPNVSSHGQTAKPAPVEVPGNKTAKPAPVDVSKDETKPKTPKGENPKTPVTKTPKDETKPKAPVTKAPKGEDPKTPVTETPEGKDPKTPVTETPKDETKPETPVTETLVTETKPETPKPSEPAPTEVVVPTPDAPVVPAPSCDVDPSDAPKGEEAVPATDAVVTPAVEADAGAVETSPAAAQTDPASTPEQPVAAEGVPVADGDPTSAEVAVEATAPCGDPKAVDLAPVDEAPAVPAQGQAVDAAVPTRDQG